MSETLDNYSKMVSVLRHIFEYKQRESGKFGRDFVNHAGLALVQKEYSHYISANELNNLLKETGYRISPISSCLYGADPLFDKHGKMYDILLNADDVDDFICEVESDNRTYLDVTLEQLQDVAH